MATGMTQAQIRERTGTSERTIRRLQQDDRFRRLVHRARRERADELNAKVPDLLATALDELRSLMVTSESDATRLGAIRTVIGLSSRLEAEELDDRLDRVEDALAAQSGWTPGYLPDEEPDDDLDG
jgi:transcriptional regulator with XRE-family HTH domain